MKIDTLVNFAGGLCLCTALLLTGCTQVPQAEVAEEKTATGETAESNGGTSNEGAAGLTLSAPNMEGLADTDIGLLARIHYATHTPDFERARTFYRALGYTEGVTGFPLTNTHQVARALGMFDQCQYELVAGEVMNMPGATSPNAIDLLQFKTPFDGTPPYDKPNHLGAAYAVFATSDFDADVSALQSLGAPLLSKPYGPSGSRFVFFRDPDGVLYRLQEANTNAAAGPSMGIYDMPYVGLNVSNLAASIEFYEKLGYTTGNIQDHIGDGDEGAAWGLDQPIQYRFADITLDRGDRHTLRLTQWLSPVDLDPPYPAPINRIGIHRIAVLVTDLDRAVNILEPQAVPFLSEVAPCCAGDGMDETGIVHVIDPDGIFIELVGAIKQRKSLFHPEHCPPLEIKLPEPAR